MKRIYYAIAMAFVCLTACSGGGNEMAEEISYQNDSVIISKDSPIISKLKVETLRKEQFSREFRTVGTVQAEPGHYAEVGVPFDGRVSKAYVRLGMRVREGESLFEFSSPEFLEATKSYFQSKRLYETAKANYDRKKSLQGSGILSQRELEEAFAESENAKNEMDYAEATLRLYGMNPSSITIGQAQKIFAPISGEVVMNKLTPGSYVKADDETLLTIADLGRVWVTAQVKERFVGAVNVGGKAEIFTDADPDEAIIGEVINVGNLVDEQTRSVQVVVSCDNSSAKLKHGMYVSVHFISEPKESILVPATAVFQGGKSSYVYVATDKPNVFLKRFVETGASDDSKTNILVSDGLVEGESVLYEGGLYLNN